MANEIHCIKGLAYVKNVAGQYAGEQALLDEGRSIASARADGWNLAMTLVIRGMLEVLRSAVATARVHLDEALTAARAIGDPADLPIILTYGASMTLASGPNRSGRAGMP